MGFKEEIKIDSEKNLAYLTINPKIYSLDVIYSVAYIFLEKNYIILEGDPDKEIVVLIKPKENSEDNQLEKVSREFFNELINYSFYKNQSEKNKNIKQTLLRTSLLTNISDSILNEESLYQIDSKSEGDNNERLTISWDEKYGNK